MSTFSRAPNGESSSSSPGKKKKNRIIEKLNELAKKHEKPARISLNIYNISMPVNYPVLKAELSNKLDGL